MSSTIKLAAQLIWDWVYNKVTSPEVYCDLTIVANSEIIQSEIVCSTPSLMANSITLSSEKDIWTIFSPGRDMKFFNDKLEIPVYHFCLSILSFLQQPLLFLRISEWQASAFGEISYIFLTPTEAISSCSLAGCYHDKPLLKFQFCKGTRCYPSGSLTNSLNGAWIERYLNILWRSL